jgi:hypothetical protein
MPGTDALIVIDLQAGCSSKILCRHWEPLISNGAADMTSAALRSIGLVFVCRKKNFSLAALIAELFLDLSDFRFQLIGQVFAWRMLNCVSLLQLDQMRDLPTPGTYTHSRAATACRTPGKSALECS